MPRGSDEGVPIGSQGIGSYSDAAGYFLLEFRVGLNAFLF
jgi:hypothetical protein